MSIKKRSTKIKFIKSLSHVSMYFSLGKIAVRDDEIWIAFRQGRPKNHKKNIVECFWYLFVNRKEREKIQNKYRINLNLCQRLIEIESVVGQSSTYGGEVLFLEPSRVEYVITTINLRTTQIIESLNFEKNYGSPKNHQWFLFPSLIFYGNFSSSRHGIIVSVKSLF